MKSAISRINTPSIDGASIAILQSKWHRDLTDSMTAKCIEVLKELGASEPEVHIVPGSLELPLAAQRLCRVQRKFDAMIAFGIIVKGDTYHFEMITHECMRGLGQVMLQEDMPIVVEVLPVLDIEHAKARAGNDEFNKGIEAAVAAAETIAWRRANLPKRSPAGGARVGF